MSRDDGDETLRAARAALLDARTAAGHWEGELSSSALSTATAACALAVADFDANRSLVERGLAYLAAHANADGGYGDTVLSASNISTTALCWAAFAVGRGLGDPHGTAAAAAEAWLRGRAGSVEPAALARALAARYGADRTFSAPILTMCAIAGRLGAGAEAWRHVPPLPFELAAFPHRLYKWLRLRVVSYAVPALVAVGLARYKNLPPRNPLVRLARAAVERRTLAVLESMQPASGGFLEAVPLSSFVVMSLVAAGRGEHPVARRGAAFLRSLARADGSFGIDTNLATWVTTLSINALAADGSAGAGLAREERERLKAWLLGQQYREEHPYTHAAPGGWAWTDLSGGVPDADDTAGAILALRCLRESDEGDGEAVRRAAEQGIGWLFGLQNADGGFPTFCRGWGHLPFDRSGTDLTAHALRAMAAWLGELAPEIEARARVAIERGVRFLETTQRQDGAWVPLWFGNQEDPNEENPTYGTARVLAGLRDLRRRAGVPTRMLEARGIAWLLGSQDADGGWGGGASPSSPSIEETALAVETLAGAREDCRDAAEREGLDGAIRRGVEWLVARTERGRVFAPAPIGFYFAKLWYFERLYPVIFTVGALSAVARGTTHAN